MEHPNSFNPSPTEAVNDPSAETPAEGSTALPTMADLDRLSADLDQVDATLAALDRDAVTEPGS